ncbi:MAG: hypothetical protein Q9173_001151 [Seirophora scorigena]
MEWGTLRTMDFVKQVGFEGHGFPSDRLIDASPLLKFEAPLSKKTLPAARISSQTRFSVSAVIPHPLIVRAPAVRNRDTEVRDTQLLDAVRPDRERVRDGMELGVVVVAYLAQVHKCGPADGDEETRTGLRLRGRQVRDAGAVLEAGLPVGDGVVVGLVGSLHEDELELALGRAAIRKISIGVYM